MPSSASISAKRAAHRRSSPAARRARRLARCARPPSSAALRARSLRRARRARVRSPRRPRARARAPLRARVRRPPNALRRESSISAAHRFARLRRARSLSASSSASRARRRIALARSAPPRVSRAVADARRNACARASCARAICSRAQRRTRASSRSRSRSSADVVDRCFERRLALARAPARLGFALAQRAPSAALDSACIRSTSRAQRHSSTHAASRNSRASPRRWTRARLVALAPRREFVAAPRVARRLRPRSLVAHCGQLLAQRLRLARAARESSARACSGRRSSRRRREICSPFERDDRVAEPLLAHEPMPTSQRVDDRASCPTRNATMPAYSRLRTHERVRVADDAALSGERPPSSRPARLPSVSSGRNVARPASRATAGMRSRVRHLPSVGHDVRERRAECDVERARVAFVDANRNWKRCRRCRAARRAAMASTIARVPGTWPSSVASSSSIVCKPRFGARTSLVVAMRACASRPAARCGFVTRRPPARRSGVAQASRFERRSRLRSPASVRRWPPAAISAILRRRSRAPRAPRAPGARSRRAALCSFARGVRPSLAAASAAAASTSRSSVKMRSSPLARSRERACGGDRFAARAASSSCR